MNRTRASISEGKFLRRAAERKLRLRRATAKKADMAKTATADDEKALGINDTISAVFRQRMLSNCLYLFSIFSRQVQGRSVAAHVRQ